MRYSSIRTDLATSGIFPYGSPELIEFENHMARYFEREYSRWEDNKCHPEDYGVSSFEGEMTTQDFREQSIAQHYDNEFQVFKVFLDKDYLAYTMAYYGDTRDEAQSADISLEEAQKNKYNLIVERAQIKDGQKILDLGCGFGGLSKYLLQRFPNITITGINPSDVQSTYICNRSREPGHPLASGRFNLIEGFFDQISDFELGLTSYDRIISMGLLEHISNMDLLFQKIARLLVRDGKCFHHCIVSVPTIPRFLNSADTIMGKYYPGAQIWPYDEPSRHNKHLQPADRWFVNGMNYWHTLDIWHKRFWDAIDQLFQTHLSKPQIDEWNKYFSLCKVMFIPCNGEMYGNGQYLYER